MSAGSTGTRAMDRRISNSSSCLFIKTSPFTRTHFWSAQRFFRTYFQKLRVFPRDEYKLIHSSAMTVGATRHLALPADILADGTMELTIGGVNHIKVNTYRSTCSILALLRRYRRNCRARRKAAVLRKTKTNGRSVRKSVLRTRLCTRA